MCDFETTKNIFFQKYNNVIDFMIQILENLQSAGAEPGDYNAYGAEFIMNGLDTGSEWYGVRDMIEDKFEDAREHTFELINHWDSHLFFNPSDIRGFIFDFSHLYEGKVLCYNGLTNNFKHEVVKEYDLVTFLQNYGAKRFYSCTHYSVQWPSLGFYWNN